MKVENFELLIKSKNKITPGELEEAKANREHLMYLLCLKELRNHPHKDANNELYQAFKEKRPVKLKSTGEEVYIHGIESNIEWETNRVVVKYIIRREGNFKEQYEKGLPKCQIEEFEL